MVSVFTRHGPTLRSLLVKSFVGDSAHAHTPQDKSYSLRDLDRLVAACSDLRVLGLNVCNMNFKRLQRYGVFRIVSSPVATAEQERWVKSSGIVQAS
jgi:hypothetical protein